MRTVILGLGNPLLRDDGVALEVIELLRKKQLGPEVELKTASMGGLRILDQIAGFQRAIIVDALMTGGSVGEVRKLRLEELQGELHASCIHDLNLAQALQLGQSLGMELPGELSIYGIEVADPYTLSEGCSPAVQAAIEQAVALIHAELNHT